MELFEILFILFFILIPIINGISRNRRRGESDDIQLPGEPRAGRPQRPGQPPRRAPTAADRPGPDRSERDHQPADAADLVPDDLWEILTGEKRERGAVGQPAEPMPEMEPEADRGGPAEPWTVEPAWQAEDRPPDEERFEPAPWLLGAPPDLPADAPSELEALAQAARYAPETRTARRLRIATQDALAAPVPRSVSPLIQSLRRPGGVRQAVVLREVLGPPKGLGR